ncbi:FeoB-associated Cys-rich membrane protein [Salidesulfovibrio brasiliensis]|uniref:FeoB-associated Cys-rich membrane protein n=1 Tax=Salidesulfovibrio brasiliensis TaxID=221711 RepID=UPI0009FA507D|nr:FeoB-associated Cys-rich membrane protein [Salidesulfovibrio brasiliensis]
MTDTIIVILIVAVAAFYVVRRFVRNAKSTGGSCGCSGCGSNCTPEQKQNCDGE